MVPESLPEALTFDDVLLQPGYSDFLPSEAEVGTQLTRDLRRNIPLLSSAMDTVTEWRMAVTMARWGGIGVLHKNMVTDDLVKALAAGASTVMIGSLLAGTDEAPGETVLYQCRTNKSYRGMGSLSAMRRGSKDRYAQADVDDLDKLVPEGIEGRVPHRGPASNVIYQLVGGLRAGMGYTGCRTVEELRHKARFVKQSAQGLRESHVHDVIITQESPNYGTNR